MAVRHARVPVGTSATNLLTLPDQNVRDGAVARTVVVQNTSGADLHLGGSGVTTSNSGYILPAGGEVSLDLGKDDVLYGVAASAVTVPVLHLGV